VSFPKYLNEVPNNLQNYGEISTYSPAIHYQCVGWYDNEAANLKPVFSRGRGAAHRACVYRKPRPHRLAELFNALREKNSMLAPEKSLFGLQSTRQRSA